MTEFTPVTALVGGALIGLAATLLLRINGRIAGISGIVNSALSRQSDDRLWRLTFIVGMIAGGLIYQWISGKPLLTRAGFPLFAIVLAGFLVGLGTRVGSGCTSGHGVCGISRLSARSLAATATFLAAGMATATFIHVTGLLR